MWRSLESKQVPHCSHDLHWILDFVKGYEITSIHVISKCGKPVTGAPKGSTIEMLPNVGRCDNSYSYYIAHILDQKIGLGKEEDTIILFLKDDMSDLHQHGSWATFESMVRIASSVHGFACGVDITLAELNGHSISAYHDVKSLSRFSMEAYVRPERFSDASVVKFKSNYSNLGEFYKSIIGDEVPLPRLTQVCYGGIFAASLKNIRSSDMRKWKRIEIALRRGDNIEEGHFMECSWARLLSTPLKLYQENAILSGCSEFISDRKSVV